MDSELITRYLKGEALPHEKEEILQWVEASAENRKQFLQLRRLYDMAIWSENKADAEQEQDAESEPTRAFSLGKIKTWLRVAAVVAFTVGGTLLVEKSIVKQDIASQVIEVPLGQRVNVTLADGTKVTLNSNSRFEFPSSFGKDIRQVKLDGEGFFHVAHNAEKPFHVQTSVCDVKVLGTTFNVLAYSSSKVFETSLLEGSVRVADLAETQHVILEPNQKVSMVDGILVVSDLETEDEFLWKDGIYVFKNETLSDIFNKLEQYYKLDIIVRDSRVNTLRCTGKFRQHEGIEHIIRVLKQTNGFRYKRDDEKNQIIIY